MPIEPGTHALPLGARRVFRLSLTAALALAFSYALGGAMPFLAPIMALALTAPPGPPLPVKALVGLLVLVVVTLGTGLLLVPVLNLYPAVGLLLVALGLFFSIDLSVNRGKAAAGTFLTMGLTIIPAAGVMSFQAAFGVAENLFLAIILAIICQHVVAPFFPEDPVPARPPTPGTGSETSAWIALRTTLIVYPVLLLGLFDPTTYLPIVMKAVSIGQQGSLLRAREAGRELLGSTFLGGIFAIVFWFGLKLEPSLFMFTLWMALLTGFGAARFYGIVASRFSPPFWNNVLVTMLILVGPAVADSAGGKDPYKAFAVRMALFVAVTLYAWAAIAVLEHLRGRRRARPAQNVKLAPTLKDPTVTGVS
jgi:hypothetical protein